MHFFPRLAEISLYLLLVSLMKSEFHTSSHEGNPMTGFWTKMLSIFSLTLSNPFIDLEHDLVCLSPKKYMEYELNLFFINSPCRLHLLLERIIPTLVRLISGSLIASIPTHKNGSEKR